MTKYDAILIPGGGIREGGTLPIWTRRRLKKALEMKDFGFIITLSAGTTHKPLPIDKNGYPIFESIAAANYLLEHGLSPYRILAEKSSYDTIGNAYFSRIIHVDPMELKRLLIITSDFHMPRTKAIFSWVYGLRKRKTEYELSFESVSDEGIDRTVLEARKEKERKSLLELSGNMKKIKTLREFHRWLFSEHDAYSIIQKVKPFLSEDVLHTY
jgi:hypothetical protein